jgi:hypothetical protein
MRKALKMWLFYCANGSKSKIDAGAAAQIEEALNMTLGAVSKQLMLLLQYLMER